MTAPTTPLGSDHRPLSARSVSRRTVLKSAVATGTLFGGVAPLLVPSRVFGANEEIHTGHIGIGGQGRGNLGRFRKHAIAVCDVDSTRAGKAAKSVSDKNGRPCEIYGDYREILDRDDIDAVVISTPDHWHALQTIHACEAGKDVYCEKPLTLTIAEGREMVEAARKHKRIVQTGSQQRSSGNFRTACEMVRSGRIGKLQRVDVGIPGPNHPGAPVPDSDPPSDLDYDAWLGSAPERPYNKKRVHYNFRFFRDYSGGQITNWGAHHLDIAQWGIGADDSGPIAVVGTGKYHPKGWHEVTESCAVQFTYADDVILRLGQGLKGIKTGTTFIGTEGSIYVNRGKLSSDPDGLLKEPLGDDAVKLYDSRSHSGNFLDCMRSRELPICDVEIGHRSATVCHLANIAAELGRPLTWNPKTERFEDDDDANTRVSRPRRAPYDRDYYQG